ncbi:MAG: tRNA (N6-isopentenyl adenosine(37)-C2)-methylthiotransferase MiaB [Proteobacteria bacterium]|nr:tRNA (N6-isopentenyl adenosine(37)-C2)-methylthiotransferase MiaB [Pseudomonadota bacterium]MBU1610809.1 tRNA (N6-isopentenyl adenosine(37)-C2)-methylthiotransferase MiaB [Pseudomonadota bacterium]
MKFHILTFGCQMNVNDSDWLARALTVQGHEAAAEDQAEVFILNTCSVRDKPEQKVYSELGRLRGYLDANPAIFAAVAGCVAQQIGQKLCEKFPFVRLVLGPDGLRHAPAALEELAEHPDRRLVLTEFLDRFEEREQAWPELAEPEAAPRTAFVNIMQGCDNFCTYCIVPFVRGRQKSRPPKAILSECQALLERGVREITLLGQNVNSFGSDASGMGVSFAQLLHQVAALSELDRLRFTTSHPKDIAPEVIRAFGELENLAPHLHLPLQSGSDRILARMGRKYDRARYLAIVDGLRQARPDIVLGTDLIVGFPGETEEDFDQTLAMVERVGFESSYSFKYSDRPGTAAERMPEKVDSQVAQGRLLRLQDLQNTITRNSLKNCVGREAVVLYEGLSRVQVGAGVFWQGRDPSFRIVNVEHPKGLKLAGKLQTVRVTQAKKHSLMGEGIGRPW